MRARLAAALATLASTASMGCGLTDAAPPTVVAIRLQPSASELLTGQTRQLTATLLDRAANAVTGREITWGTSAPTVATVSQTGLVSAVGAGQASISALVDGATASVAVRVFGPAASVEISPDQATLDVPTDQIRLLATVRDAGGSVWPGWVVSWTSADPGIAQVGSDGLVTPKGVGTTTISAASEGRVSHATLTVVRLPIESVRVSPSPIGLIGNRTLLLTATVLGPGDKTLLGRAIEWSSTSTAVATVNQAGLVTSHSPGAATITATTEGHTAQVPVRVFPAISFSSVTSGGQHTCSVSAEGVFCWGDNGFGQLGSSGELCDGGWYYDDYPCATHPTAVVGGMNFVVLTAGESHTCGLSPVGEAYCWGNGGSGQLGQGILTGSIAPVRVQGGLLFSVIAAGNDFTCGVTVGAAAYCWGDNAGGRLGDGTIASRPGPVAVVGGLSFSVLSSGFNHTCGITTAARLYCWGGNNFGQLGDGSATHRASPVAVAGNLSAIAVDAGAEHTCAVTTAGEGYCWGHSQDGGLGSGASYSSAIPVPVSGGLRWKTISAGQGFTCGTASDDRAYCWGTNSSGQLGISSNLGRPTPTAVAIGLPFAAISAGGYHTCGRLISGVLFCWGAGWSGQLGTGNLGTQTIPVKVQGQP